MGRTKFIAVLLLFLGACSTAQLNFPSSWQSSLRTDHPLVGAIWDSQQNQFIGSVDLLTRLEKVSYLLLGEKHDNPDHHALQQSMLNYFIDGDKLSRVSFEMIDSGQQVLLDTLSKQQLGSLEAINNHLEWNNEGWNWAFYGPLLQSALSADVDVMAANISDEEVKQIYADPTPSELATILNEQAMVTLEKEIDESHCGLLPESQFPAMVRVQQARDYAMAESLSMSNVDKIQILIAGNYHIRHDQGVPLYLLSKHVGLEKQEIATLAFMEVSPEADDPAEYLQQFGDVKAYDYIWFTPAISDEDYCALLRQ